MPYPLSLLPKASWQALNRGSSDAICSSCGKARTASAHQRKLFLVAERLSWELGTVSFAARSQNEEELWVTNAELGIFEPAVDDQEVVIGGRRSREDGLYPYKQEEEVEFAMRLIATAEMLSEASWAVWRGMVGRMMTMMQADRKADPPDITRSTPRRSPRKNGKQVMEIMPTPPSSYMDKTTTDQPLTCSYDTLQDFYSLLDKIERTSPMGARFLEAYADRLHNETCERCWFTGIAVADQGGGEAVQSSPLSHRTAFALEQYGATRSPRIPIPRNASARGAIEMRTPIRPAR